MYQIKHALLNFKPEWRAIGCKMREKKSGAVYWLEIAAGILLVILIILVINKTNWSTWISSLETNVNNMINQVAGYWTGVKLAS